jgi:lysyl-tRNA synthetase class 2
MTQTPDVAAVTPDEGADVGHEPEVNPTPALPHHEPLAPTAPPNVARVIKAGSNPYTVLPQPSSNTHVSRLRHYRSVRRLSALMVLLYAFALLAAGTRLRDSISLALNLGLPLPVPRGAVLVSAAVAMVVAGTARGLLRGQRAVFRIVMGLLLLTAVLHLLRRDAITVSVLSLIVVGFLYVERNSFRARTSMRAVITRLIALAIVSGIVVLAGFALYVIWYGGVRGHGFNIDALLDTTRAPMWVRIMAAIVILGVAVAIGWALTAPDETTPVEAADSFQRARDLVEQYGDDSLSYFALRDDKKYVIAGEGLVSYAVFDGICLVSPDPIGPDASEAWTQLREFTEEQGWPTAIMSTSEANAKYLRDEGMTVLYIGDEAVIDARGFRLAGQDRKSLRQAVNRMRKNNYETSVILSKDLTAEQRAEVLAIAPITRQGAEERGFSMSLSRIADPCDNTVTVLVRDPEGALSAFLQFVPSPGLNGWSLDVMRRDGRKHPNGIMELAIVDFFEWVEKTGGERVSLNFTVFRTVLDGTTSIPGLFGLERKILKWAGQSTQMDTLYRFNAKFDPEWVPRYAAVEAPEYLVPTVLAILKAEGVSEIPVVGRLMASARR